MSMMPRRSRGTLTFTRVFKGDDLIFVKYYEVKLYSTLRKDLTSKCVSTCTPTLRMHLCTCGYVFSRTENRACMLTLLNTEYGVTSQLFSRWDNIYAFYLSLIDCDHGFPFHIQPLFKIHFFFLFFLMLVQPRGRRGLTLTWYMYMCLPFEVPFL